MKKLKSVSLLLVLLLGLATVAYQQKESVGCATGPESKQGGILKTAKVSKTTPDAASLEINYPENSVYGNPIDGYFLPRMAKQHISMAELKYLQLCYHKVWKDEFEHFVEWMEAKCVYQEDKTHLADWKKTVEKNIRASQEVIATELLDVYEVHPDPEKAKNHISRASAWGNGTVYRLKQLEGESYRNAVMQVVNLFTDKKYIFRNIDYAKITP